MTKMWTLAQFVVDVSNEYMMFTIGRYDNEETYFTSALLAVEKDGDNYWVCLFYVINLFYNGNDGGEV